MLRKCFVGQLHEAVGFFFLCVYAVLYGAILRSLEYSGEHRLSGSTAGQEEKIAPLEPFLKIHPNSRRFLPQSFRLFLIFRTTTPPQKRERGQIGTLQEETGATS